jgi:hypothetical protein
MMDLEVFMWAIAGGIFVSLLSAGAVYYQKDIPTNKQLGRDFLLGATVTGFLYPLIPESFDDIKGVIQTTAGGLQSGIANTVNIGSSMDPGVKIGPANF